MAGVLRLGLTGGIGSGKSTVARLLVGRGAALLDADAIARQVTASGGAAIAAIAQAFGPDFITSEGALDRDRMRALAFTDGRAKERLEAIVHPLVGQETARSAAAAIQAGHHCLVFDIPLLVESGRWRGQLDRVMVVDCRPETQVARVTARSGLAPEAVRAIMAAQAPRALRLAAADDVIFNDGVTLQQLEALVTQWAGTFGL
ncbi:MAG: dephospho-CoA kinase [Ramlibacter sp.]|nr:dephospho-CoA kinase [Ramlibacter sp.]